MTWIIKRKYHENAETVYNFMFFDNFILHSVGQITGEKNL